MITETHIEEETVEQAQERFETARATLEAARKRKQQEEEKDAELVRQAELKAKREANKANRKPFWDKVLEAILAAPHDAKDSVSLVEFTDSNYYGSGSVHYLQLNDGKECVGSANVVLETVDRYRYYSRPFELAAITVGNHGNKKRFPKRKDGSFNYPAIAKEYWERIATTRVKALQRTAQNQTYARGQQMKEANKALAESIRDLNYRNGITFEPSDQVEGKLFVTVNFNSTMTVEQLRATREFIDNLSKKPE